ncbi:ABC transporter permease [Lactobacillus xylocopicola]|uniref:ABC transporter permease n=1 Tax=Lactobacillus xylocopicola TaxID=2976676 RepID=A0ABM8BEX1_9LACO|nr:ABC transporter permease [Lactobacillus xylocopicola]BDR59784.1 ABC transporter permease [Lactobacillus xylocopicola]
MNKLWIVTFQTYWRQVKSWSFVTLVFMPFIFIGVSILFGLVGGNSADSTNSDQQIAVISQNAQLRQSFIKSNKNLVDADIKTATAAHKKLASQDIDGYLVLKLEHHQLQATYHGAGSVDDELKAKVMNYAQKLQGQINLQRASLTPQQAQALAQKPRYQEILQRAHSKGDNKLAQYISLVVLIFMSYMILILYSSVTAQEIAAEKGSKIMEIIFSSTTAAKYFFGKILGIFGVILTQVAIYILGGAAIYQWALHASQTAPFMHDNQHLINEVLGNLLNVNLLFVILGVVIYIILAAFSGALVAKVEDSSKAASWISFLVMLAFIVTFMFINQPDQLLAQIMSYVPLFSSFVMPLRIISGHVGTLEISISLAILVISELALMVYISKIYQGLILQTEDTSFWKRLKRGLSYSKA